jgi:hypothetical protein
LVVIELTGLPANNLQGLLASYGVLRVCTLKHPDVTLCWRDGVAIIDGIDLDGIMNACIDHLHDREKKPGLAGLENFVKLGGVRVEDWDKLPTEWRDMYWYIGQPKHCSLQMIASVSEAGNVLWTRLKQKKPKGATLHATRLDLTATVKSNTHWLKAVRDTVTLVRKQPDTIKRSLFSLWLRSDTVTSMRFDLGSAKLGASMRGDELPTVAKHVAEAATQWLAWEALPLFPARWIARFGDGVSIVVPVRPITYRHAEIVVPTATHGRADALFAQGWLKIDVGVAAIGNDVFFDVARTSSDREIAVGSRARKNNGLRIGSINEKPYFA